MLTFVTALHVVACVFLILVVLLQTGKGADIGAAFGGGASQTVFGGRGAATFLSKLTTAVAIVFMLTSLLQVYLGKQSRSQDVGAPPAVEQPAPTPTGGEGEPIPMEGGEQSEAPPIEPGPPQQ